MVKDLIFVKPEEEGLSSEKVIRFIRSVRERRINLHSFMLIRNGKILTEAYYRPITADFQHRIYSSSKSIVALAVGLLVGEGKIKELRKNAVNENVVVQFANDVNKERIFSFPLCFLQGYLELQKGWEEIVTNTTIIETNTVNSFVQSKGEEVENEDISILRAYFGVQTNKPSLYVYDKLKGEGIVAEYFGESIKVSFFLSAVELTTVKTSDIIFLQL